MTVLCFLPSLRNQFTNWDDDLYVTNNPLIRGVSAENLWRVATRPVAFNYHPLTIWSLQANYLLSGLNPFAYHLTSLLLHVLNGILVFHLIFLLTRGGSEAALVGALLFAVHPLHVESVAWISERKDLLYSLFTLLALVAYTRYVQARPRRPRRLLEVLLFSCLSLFSKPAAVALPALLLAVDYLEGRRLLSREVLLEKLPFLALSAVFGVVTLRIQSAFISVGSLQILGVPEKLLVASYGLMMYLIKFVVPWRLSAFYPYPDYSSGWPPGYLVSPLVVILIAGATVWSVRHTRVVAGGMLFFLGSLILVLQIVPVGLAVMADRYTYLAYVGLILIVAMGYGSMLRAWKARPGRLLVARSGYVAFIGALAALTWGRVGVWRTSETLWSDVIQQYPSCGTAYVSRGTFRMKESGDLAGARRDLDRAVELGQDDYMAFYNRGLLLQRGGDLEGAARDYARAIQANPSKSDPYNNRAGVLVQLGKYDEALRDFDRAIAIEPENAGFRFNRAATCFKAGRYERALSDYNAGLRLDSARPEERFFSGVCEFRLGRYPAALEAYDAALRLDPSQGRYYLFRARCLAALNRTAEAASDARRAKALGESVEEGLLRSVN